MIFLELASFRPFKFITICRGSPLNKLLMINYYLSASSILYSAFMSKIGVEERIGVEVYKEFSKKGAV